MKLSYEKVKICLYLLKGFRRGIFLVFLLMGLILGVFYSRVRFIVIFENWVMFMMCCEVVNYWFDVFDLLE